MIAYPIGTSGQVLLFSDAVLDTFHKYRQRRWWQREAGGQLFARFEPTQILIMEATAPGRSDFRTRHSFRPSRRREQRDILRRHAEGLHFVGDWHTHPEAVPQISFDDAESMKEIVNRSRHDLNGFVLVIVGTEAGPDGVCVSVFGKSSFTTLSATQCQAEHVCAPAWQSRNAAAVS